jgi:hypothetical protein
MEPQFLSRFVHSKVQFILRTSYDVLPPFKDRSLKFHIVKNQRKLMKNNAFCH